MWTALLTTMWAKGTEVGSQGQGHVKSPTSYLGWGHKGLNPESESKPEINQNLYKLIRLLPTSDQINLQSLSPFFPLIARVWFPGNQPSSLETLHVLYINLNVMETDLFWKTKDSLFTFIASTTYGFRSSGQETKTNIYISYYTSQYNNIQTVTCL